MSLEVKHLTHTYSAGSAFQATAVHDVSLTIEDGEFVCIVGHTGSGKSTLVQHLNGLLKPTSGQVLFEGQDIWADKALTHSIRFQVGLVFQYPEYQLFEETVYKDISFGPRNMGLSEEEIDFYASTKEPYDKAGAYAIQGRAALWLDRIEGDYYTIMGLPVSRTVQLVERFV